MGEQAPCQLGGFSVSEEASGSSAIAARQAEKGGTEWQRGSEAAWVCVRMNACDQWLMTLHGLWLHLDGGGWWAAWVGGWVGVACGARFARYWWAGRLLGLIDCAALASLRGSLALRLLLARLGATAAAVFDVGYH